MKIDYNKYVGKKLHPKLKEIMTEVFCKMPQLTFRATDAHPHEGVIIEVMHSKRYTRSVRLRFYVKRIVAMR
jgi:hypothetical protein